MLKACAAITIKDVKSGSITKELDFDFVSVDLYVCFGGSALLISSLNSRAFFSSQQADETLDFEEQILEAAKSIAAATSALVKSASAAQRELVAQGKVSDSRLLLH